MIFVNNYPRDTGATDMMVVAGVSVSSIRGTIHRP
jgi:hypothetical protein